MRIAAHAHRSRLVLVRIAWSLAIVAVLAAACGGADADQNPAPDAGSNGLSPVEIPEGSPRPYALGFAAVPAALTEEAYADTFALAAQQGDLVMIQRAVPWEEVAPGAALLPETESTIVRERQLLDEHGLELLFAIDPWEPTDRSRLAGNAPGRGFTDSAVSDAYLAYVELVVERYQPRWLALAVDLDGFAQARPDDLEAFQAIYIQAYRRVKTLAPETRVFATFQLEDLQGLLPWGTEHAPQWSLILRFAPFLDLLAVSSFPSFTFPFVGDIPLQYYSRLLTFKKPLALVPVGYASEPGREGVTFGTEAGQQRFVARLLEEAEAARWELVVWSALQDPVFAQAPPFDLVSRMGLRDVEGKVKAAWDAWTAQARRPWEPDAAPVLLPEPVPGEIPELEIPLPASVPPADAETPDAADPASANSSTP